MATCKECLFWEACRGMYHPIQGWLEDSCRHFKNKADYAEVKHGMWLYGETDNLFIVEIYCPWCGKSALYDEEDDRPVESDFSPHCGAIMNALCADPSWPFFKNSLKQANKQTSRKETSYVK